MTIVRAAALTQLGVLLFQLLDADGQQCKALLVGNLSHQISPAWRAEHSRSHALSSVTVIRRSARPPSASQSASASATARARMSHWAAVRRLVVIPAPA